MKIVIEMTPQMWALVREGHIPVRAYECIVKGTPLHEATWEGIEYDGYANGCPVYDVWECTQCGYEHHGESDTLTDYCPGCGAKMTESEDVE